jgi:hypothetical protein
LTRSPVPRFSVGMSFHIGDKVTLTINDIGFGGEGI